MIDYPTLRTAAFDRKRIKAYWLWQPTIIMACTLVLIPVIPVVLIITILVIDKYLDRLSCELTTRTLEVRKGLFNRVESTVPLEKITDVQFYQGPIMRLIGVEGFRVETAGQSSGAAGGFLVNMIGIEDTRGFRQAILTQRDKLANGDDTPARATPASSPTDAPDQLAALRTISDTLLRIEQKLDQSS
ncbi:MAG: PH domain-containing protein [Phycisphaerales bacterium JB059]